MVRARSARRLFALGFRLVEAVLLAPLAAFGAGRVIIAAAPRLLRLAARIIATIVVILTPVLLAAGWFAAKLLPLHDINFYLARRPPEFMQAAYIVGGLGFLAAGLGLWLGVRWCVAAQACVLGEKDAPGSLRLSANLVAGARWRAAGLLVFGLLLLLANEFLDAAKGRPRSTLNSSTTKAAGRDWRRRCSRRSAAMACWATSRFSPCITKGCRSPANWIPTSPSATCSR